MTFFPKYSQFRSALRQFRLKDNLAIKMVIGLSTIVTIALMFPRGEAIEYEYKIGGIWVEADLIAPFSFPIFKDAQQYDQERRAVSMSVYRVFGRDTGIEESQRGSLVVMLGSLRTSSEFRPLWLRRKALLLLYDDIAGAGIVDNGKVKQDHKFLAVRKGNEEEIVPSERFYDLDEALTQTEKALFEMFGERLIAAKGIDIFRSVLKPNVLFNETETSKLILVAIESVPRTVGFVQQNERIVGKHERISEEVLLKLDSLRRAKAERGAAHGHTWQYVGMAAHVALVLALYGIYLYLFRKRIFHDNRMLALIAVLMIMECFFAYLSLSLEVKAPVQYLIFLPAASMLLAIIFDSRVAFYGTVILAFLIAGVRGNDYSVALASLVAGALSVYTVRDIKNRTQIFRSLLFILLGYACAILALNLERFAPIETTVGELTFALANAIFSPVLTYGLLIFFERVFRVTTDLTLLELSDFNSPLLRQLSERAPGTFHHSVTLGSLAEAAAEAIGANAILARVGAYYHDIGKMLKPEYFAENQSQGKSKHTRLRPRMSALIIASHVKEGVELGRQHRLPEIVLEFIPQHHGTTMISYFYDKAVKQAETKQNPKDEVQEANYRYPGPKPQTKETGIVMLADAAEATARALDDPAPRQLETMIDGIIRSRFMEGQLGECDLTLRDLTKIKEAFLKILIGIHHTRIKYPAQQEETKQPEPVRPVNREAVPDAVSLSSGSSGNIERNEGENRPQNNAPVA